MSNFCHPLIMPNFCHQKRTLLLKEFLVIFTFRIVFTRHSVAPDWQKVLFFKITIVLTASCQNYYRFEDLWPEMLSDTVFVWLSFWWCTLVWGGWGGGGHVRWEGRPIEECFPGCHNHPPLHTVPSRHPVFAPSGAFTDSDIPDKMSLASGRPSGRPAPQQPRLKTSKRCRFFWSQKRAFFVKK